MKPVKDMTVEELREQLRFETKLKLIGATYSNGMITAIRVEITERKENNGSNDKSATRQEVS